MINILALIMIFWSMLYTIARFFQYYRIVTEYKDTTIAKVIKVSPREQKSKKEGKAVDVILEYFIDGKDMRSEIVVPIEMAEKYPLGKDVSMCYKVSGNGAVHIASDTTATKKLMQGYAVAIAFEFLAFAVIWWMML